MISNEYIWCLGFLINIDIVHNNNNNNFIYTDKTNQLIWEDWLVLTGDQFYNNII